MMKSLPAPEQRQPAPKGRLCWEKCIHVPRDGFQRAMQTKAAVHVSKKLTDIMQFVRISQVLMENCRSSCRSLSAVQGWGLRLSAHAGQDQLPRGGQNLLDQREADSQDHTLHPAWPGEKAVYLSATGGAANVQQVCSREIRDCCVS